MKDSMAAVLFTLCVLFAFDFGAEKLVGRVIFGF